MNVPTPNGFIYAIQAAQDAEPLIAQLERAIELLREILERLKEGDENNSHQS